MVILTREWGVLLCRVPLAVLLSSQTVERPHGGIWGARGPLSPGWRDLGRSGRSQGGRGCSRCVSGGTAWDLPGIRVGHSGSRIPLWAQDLVPHGAWLISAQGLKTREHKLSPGAFHARGADAEGGGRADEDAQGPCFSRLCLPCSSEPLALLSPGRDVAVQAGAGRAEAMDREDSEASAGLLRAHRGHGSTQLRREGHGQEESSRYVQSWVCETAQSSPGGRGRGTGRFSQPP